MKMTLTAHGQAAGVTHELELARRTIGHTWTRVGLSLWVHPVPLWSIGLLAYSAIHKLHIIMQGIPMNHGSQ
jgi:hypothetical protein